MEVKRKPFQGVVNIIRFNWHFYVLSALILATTMVFNNVLPQALRTLIIIGSIMTVLSIAASLLVSFYIYDLSDLYKLNWLENLDNKKILNINAGFDETSDLLLTKFPEVNLTICDFYDPEKHREVSIKRARKAFPPNPATLSVECSKLPFPEDYFDKSLAILAAHEIRNEDERVQLFRELNRVTKSSGQIMITEHLRDINNFMAYNIGFFHFHSKKTWLKTFVLAGLTVRQEIKSTPYITTFVLEDNGNTL